MEAWCTGHHRLKADWPPRPLAPAPRSLPTTLWEEPTRACGLKIRSWSVRGKRADPKLILTGLSKGPEAQAMTCDSKEYAQSPCSRRQIRAEEHMQGGERQGPGK